MNRLLILSVTAAALAQAGELRFCLRADPKTFNPILVSEESGEAVRYLTGGVLIRTNRVTQKNEPELARSWRISRGGRRIEFDLRPGLRFSDGVALTAEHVAYTLRVLTDAATHSPTGDPLRIKDQAPAVEVLSPARVAVTFAGPVAGVERLFDQVAIVPGRAAENDDPVKMPVAGPYRVAEYKPGSHILLSRNPYYWKTDAAGRRLPYIAAVRLYIQQNRDLELRRFSRGEIHLINRLDPELARGVPAARDLGPSFDTEHLWFNQAPGAPIPAHKKAWFQSRDFRRAVSSAIRRDDLSRVVYLGRATPAAGPVSPANRVWFNSALQPERFDLADAQRRLEGLGLRVNNSVLRDASGRAVEFSIVTNSGNRQRERMAAMIQQDLLRIGIRVRIVTLDFPSLIDRITRTQDYDACLLGLVNVDADPNGQMNVWLSSGAQHQWDPMQAKPRTQWEAELDRLMMAQSTELAQAKRKALFDQAQNIIREEAPFIYLVTKNALCAISPRVRNTAPSPLHPQTYWNIERLELDE
jgi:peptide/nickel transport system substrate-binding protein